MCKSKYGLGSREFQKRKYSDFQQKEGPSLRFAKDLGHFILSHYHV